MSQINATARNLAALIVLAALAGAVFWLIARPPGPEEAQPAVQATGRPTPAAAAAQTTQTPHPTPTASAAPQPTRTPFTPEVVVGKGSIVTAPPPKPTPTPLGVGPDAAVQAISDAPLLSSDLLSLMQVAEHDPILVAAWPAPDEIILRVGVNANAAFWAVSPQQGQAQRLPEFQAFPDTTAAVAELRQFDERVDYASVSPDGQWAAWGQGETLLVKRLETGDPPINLLGVIEYERFQRGAGTLVWSLAGDQLAYVVDNDPQNRYEIRLTDPFGRQTGVVTLRDTSPHHLAWSPDGRYLAFKMLEEPQSGTRHAYVVKQDGSGLTQLTQHGAVDGPLHWSPTGEALVYTHDMGAGDRPWLVGIVKKGTN